VISLAVTSVLNFDQIFKVHIKFECKVENQTVRCSKTYLDALKPIDVKSLEFEMYDLSLGHVGKNMLSIGIFALIVKELDL